MCVYRFVRLGNMKVVEIYPGDGSVFVSQGITAHFFSHIVWKGGKVSVDILFSMGTCALI